MSYTALVIIEAQQFGRAELRRGGEVQNIHRPRSVSRRVVERQLLRAFDDAFQFLCGDDPYCLLDIQLKRRTRVAAIFANEASLLRLVSALLAETSDQWVSSNTYLDMNPSIPPST